MRNPSSLSLRLGLTSVLAAVALAPQAALGQTDSTPQPPGEPKPGQMIRGVVNPYSFSPKDDSVVVDASNVNLRQLLEDLGPDAIEWYQHVQTLSNPWFEGRCPGSDGHGRAVEYLEWWMKKIGLEPAFAAESSGGDANATNASIAALDGRGYRQPFELSGRAPTVASGALAINGTRLERDKDFIVCGASATGEVAAPLAFAGYGILEGLNGYTSFDGDDDLKGRIAIVFRWEPLDQDGNERWAKANNRPRVRMTEKLSALIDRGAVGIIVVNAPGATAAERPLEDLRVTRWGGAKTVPIVQMTTDAADALVRQADSQGRDLMTLRQLADEGSIKDVAFKKDVVASLAADVKETKVPAANVGGVLRGKGDLSDEWIIIGGHFDHVGYGLFGTDPKNRGQLHPGADDNASGTAGVLVMARQLKEIYDAAPSDANLRSILFLTFSAEESGLDGSKFYVKHPTLNATQINAMLNMDMIGRLRSDDLTLYGIGTAKELDAKVEGHVASSGLIVRADPSGQGPSDQQSFYNADIPVLFITTGTHDVYHRPGDKGYTINPSGAIKTIAFLRGLALDLADDEQRLTFTKTEGRSSDRGYAGVRLGLMPAMGEADLDGVLVESVSEDTAASEAGLRKGDLLLSWNGKELTGAGDMMSRLREHKPGDHVTIRIRRDGKEEDVDVKLRASRRRE